MSIFLLSNCLLVHCRIVYCCIVQLCIIHCLTIHLGIIQLSIVTNCPDVYFYCAIDLCPYVQFSIRFFVYRDILLTSTLFSDNILDMLYTGRYQNRLPIGTATINKVKYNLKNICFDELSLSLTCHLQSTVAVVELSSSINCRVDV